MVARILMAAGALVAVGGSLLTYLRFGGVIRPDVDHGTFSYWELSSGSDVALAVIAAVTLMFALVRWDGAAALGAAAIAGFTLTGLIDSLGDGEGGERAGVYVMALGGALAIAGAILTLRQRSTRTS